MLDIINVIDTTNITSNTDAIDVMAITILILSKSSLL